MPTNEVTSYSDLSLDIINQLPGVSTAAVLNWLQRAGRQFCLETYAWTEDLLPIAVNAYQTDYVLAHSYDASIEQVEYVTVNSSSQMNAQYYRLMPAAPQAEYIRFDANSVPSIASDVSAYDSSASYSAGDYASHSGEYYRCVVAIGAGGEAWTANHWVIAYEKGLRARVVFRPSFNATGISSWLYDRYGHVILARVRMFAQTTPGPWNMPLVNTRTRRGQVNMAYQEAETEWVQGVASAKLDRLMNSNGADLRASTPTVMDPVSGKASTYAPWGIGQP